MGNNCGTQDTNYYEEGSRHICNFGIGIDRSEYSDKITVKMTSRVCFGAGSYWGTEKFLRHHFGDNICPESKIRGMVGFMGPADAPENPTYAEVCTGTTGHVEVYCLDFEGGPEVFDMIVRFFFQFHDPTTSNSQGNDHGTQYASVIYCYDKNQFSIAKKIKRQLQSLIYDESLNCFTNKKVTTKILRSTVFYPTNAKHQDYLFKHPNGYCNHHIYFDKWPDRAYNRRISQSRSRSRSHSNDDESKLDKIQNFQTPISKDSRKLR